MTTKIDDIADTAVHPRTFEYALRLIRGSGATSLIEEWQIQDGGPQQSKRYPSLAILVGWTILILERSQLTHKHLTELLVARLSDSQRASLSMPQRSLKSEALVREVAGRVYADMPEGDEKRVHEMAWLSVYQNIYRANEICLRPWNASPFPRHRSLSREEIHEIVSNLTREEKSRLSTMADRATQLSNRIIRASLPTLPPGGWTGHVVGDLTVIPTDVAQNWEVGMGPSTSANADATPYPRDRYHRFVFGYGATIIKAHPDKNFLLGGVVLSVAFGAPNGGTAFAMDRAMSAAKEAGTVCDASTVKPRCIITDRGYLSYKFKVALAKQGFQQVHGYLAKDEHKIRVIDDSSAFIFHGMTFCVGARPLAERYAREAASGKSIEQLRPLHETLEGLRMRSTGSPRLVNEGPTSETTAWLAKRECPLTTGRVFCPLWQTTDPSGAPVTADTAEFRIPIAPTGPDLPRTCTRSNTTFKLNGSLMNALQPVPYLSAAWLRLYGPGRSHDEAAHGVLKATGGVSFRPNRFVLRHSGVHYLFVAIGLSDVNRRYLERRSPRPSDALPFVSDNA